MDIIQTLKDLWFDSGFANFASIDGLKNLIMIVVS